MDAILNRWTFAFRVQPGDIVDAVILADVPVLNHALADSIGTRPPRGANQTGPSTYWIDRVSRDLQQRVEEGSDGVFASGDVTHLSLRQDSVRAHYDFEQPGEAADAMPVADFVRLLTEWRQETIAVSPGADRRVPPRSS